MISTIGAVVQAIQGRFEPSIPVSLFYRDGGYGVDGIQMDLILSEDHSVNAVVTQHPVQDGSVISDHISVLPRSGTFRALVSNYSISKATPSEEEDTWQDVYERGEEQAKVLPNRAANTWKALQDLVQSRRLVQVVTALEVYDNVALTAIRTSRDGESGDALEIEVDFEQVQIVQLRETRVTAQVQPTDMKSTINQKSANQVNAGQQVGTQATPEEEQQLELGEVGV